MRERDWLEPEVYFHNTNQKDRLSDEYEEDLDGVCQTCYSYEVCDCDKDDESIVDGIVSGKISIADLEGGSYDLD